MKPRNIECRFCTTLARTCTILVWNVSCDPWLDVSFALVCRVIYQPQHTQGRLVSCRVDHRSGPSAGRVGSPKQRKPVGRVGSDGRGFADMQFATDYNNGITYVINVLSMRVGSGRQFRVHDGSGRVQKRVTRGQLWSHETVTYYKHSFSVKCCRVLLLTFVLYSFRIYLSSSTLLTTATTHPTNSVKALKA